MYLTIDVETNGLYGEAFSYGAVLTTSTGEMLLESEDYCQYKEASPDKRDSTPELTEEFLRNKVIPAAGSLTCQRTEELRSRFFSVWLLAMKAAKATGEPLYIVADVAYPCETTFLRHVRTDDVQGRDKFTVYPLIDLASMLFAKGFDPTATFPRRANELPAHNPLNDARQSSRILHMLLRGEDFEGE